MNQTMNPRTKLILMNAAVAAGLAYRLWKGAPLAVVAVAGVIMFTLVNLLMFFAAGKSSSRI